MKKFLKNLEEELKKKNINDEEIKEILADHQEMIESAINEGLTDEELEAKFGNPKQVADELSQFTDKQGEKVEKGNTDIIFNGVADNYEIEIGLLSEDIDIKTHDQEEIIIKPIAINDIDKYTIEFNNNKLLIKAPKRNGTIFFRTRNRKFKLYLPVKYQISHFKTKSINGDVDIENIKVNEFEIGTNNGDLKLKGLELSQFKASVINGDIDVINVTCDEFHASMISGDANIKNLVCKNDIFINTVSGDVEIVGSSCKEAVLKTVSGDLDGEEFYPEALSLTSVSGDISIKNKDKNKPIEIKRKKSVSGDVEILIG
ncbi:DUF4097 family beta strand repeat-containing protein [Candidatus Izemoplasma sp. B36]|uniref:DUF4097 family beta strand repeat-containing protein n=1 Tax=Candidatus Izemoplasma sp. B36 TaxID=3242468 RepID=UPI0035582675